MNCSRAKEHLAELVAGELPASAASALRTHIAGCDRCGRDFDETSATLALLGRLRAEPAAGYDELPPDFAASLHRALVSAGAPPKPGLLARLAERVTWPPLLAAGAGAAIAAAIVFVALPRHDAVVARAAAPRDATPQAVASPSASGPVAPVFRVPHDKVAMVRIDFVAEASVDNVEFAVVLPEGLHFVSRGLVLPDREFRWHGRLEQGSNPIPIAVRGERAGRYVVAARVTGLAVDAEHEVVLEVTSG